MVVGYPGQFDVFLARLLTYCRGKPLIWDVFMSTYLVALERKLDQVSPFTVKALRQLEKIALKLPDRLIQDTASYVEWLTATYNISSDKFGLVPTGADDSIFFPIEDQEVDPDIFKVQYYGTFIPNHGIPIMLEAAHLLAYDSSIKFEFIGQGPEQQKSMQLAKELQLSNVTFIDWIEKSTLPKHIATANLSLGAFGDTPQSLMTVQNKIYECLSMRKPVISGISIEAQATFENGIHLALCERTPKALAATILELRKDPTHCQEMAEAGWNLFHDRYDLQHIGMTFSAIIQELIAARKF
jgi:glycosyltransferase involved in cell wall biosynthesis